MRVLARNRYELYLSFFIVLIAFLLTAHFPLGIYNFLILAGSRVSALFCVVNALLDIRRMSLMEQAIAIPWFVFLVYSAPATVWWVAHVQGFADR